MNDIPQYKDFINVNLIDKGCSSGKKYYFETKIGGKVRNYDKSPWNHYETGIIATKGCLEV